MKYKAKTPLKMNTSEGPPSPATVPNGIASVEQMTLPLPEKETLLPAPLYVSYVEPTHLTRLCTHLFL